MKSCITLDDLYGFIQFYIPKFTEKTSGYISFYDCLKEKLRLWFYSKQEAIYTTICVFGVDDCGSS